MIEVKPRGRIALWGRDLSVQPNALELGTADSASDITGLKAEWKSVYPTMQFQLILPTNTTGVTEDKWK